MVINVLYIEDEPQIAQWLTTELAQHYMVYSYHSYEVYEQSGD